MTNTGFAELIKLTRGLWPTATFTRETLHAWRLKLQRFDDDIAKTAVFKLSETHRWLPALADVHDLCVRETNHRIALTQANHTAHALPPGHRTPARRWWSTLDDATRDQWRTHVRTTLPPVMADSPSLHDGRWPEWAETLTIQTAWQHQGQEAAA